MKNLKKISTYYIQENIQTYKMYDVICSIHITTQFVSRQKTDSLKASYDSVNHDDNNNTSGNSRQSQQAIASRWTWRGKVCDR